jgi:hypothetical protein
VCLLTCTEPSSVSVSPRAKHADVTESAKQRKLLSNACKADGLRNIAAYSHASLATDGVRTALQSVSQHIAHQVQLYIDTFL